VPIGGAYRLIDVPMSNCLNSGINKIYILTQYNSASLNRHLAHTYNFGNGVNFGNGYVEVTHVHTCFKTSKLHTHDQT
jgi:glucose-1-phosphate adenylyltransferase